MSGVVPVRFSPLFSQPEDMLKHFRLYGYDDDIKRFVLFDDYCVLELGDHARACDFLKEFDGKVINDVQVRVSVMETEDSAPSREDRHYEEPPERSFTISVFCDAQNVLSDRVLWETFKDIGFVRQIECINGVGYVQFDSEDDAKIAHEELNGKEVEGYLIYVQLIPDRILNRPRLGIPLEKIEIDEASIQKARDKELMHERDANQQPKSNKPKKDKKKKQRHQDRDDFKPVWERERPLEFEGI